MPIWGPVRAPIDTQAAAEEPEGWIDVTAQQAGRTIAIVGAPGKAVERRSGGDG